jgi:isopentenyl diphosphate isomerase/L-lactate dehydrogenase-like FMN-dependent dehydrogenase
LHALAGAGSAGLDRILSIFSEDINVVMAQIGVKGIYEIDKSVLARSQE